jgi:hypothetical protein
MRPFTFGLLLLLTMLLCSCQTMSDAKAQGIHDNAQASANAAASLPPSKQTAAIIDSQKAIAAAVGQPITSTTVVTP